MPWNKNSELPETVTSPLPPEAQTIFRKAANSVLKNDQDEKSAMKIGWAAVEDAGWSKGDDDKWVKLAREDIFAKLHEFDVEIFSVGSWNGDEYSASDLENMVGNFNALAAEIKPPVKLGHNKDQEKTIMRDGQPAMGWIKSLKKVGDKLIATLTQVPAVVYDAIKNGRYKRVSSEMYWNYKSVSGNIYSRVISAVALLGADIPAVTNLADLETYLSQSTSKGSFDSVKVYEFEIFPKNKSNNRKSNKDKKENSTMNEKEFEAKLAKMQQERDAAIEANKKTGDELKEFKKTQAEAVRESRVTELKDFCEEQVKTGKMLPAFRDNFFKNGLEKLPYSDEHGFTLPVDFFKNFMKDHKVILDKKEYGETGDSDKKVDLSDSESIADEVDRLTREYARVNKVDYDVALDAILEDPKHAELAKAYTIS